MRSTDADHDCFNSITEKRLRMIELKPKEIMREKNQIYNFILHISSLLIFPVPLSRISIHDKNRMLMQSLV